MGCLRCFSAAAAGVVAATVIAAAAAVAGNAVAAIVAAAAEQDQQDDDPAQITTAKTVVTHRKDLRKIRFRGLRCHSFQCIPKQKKCEYLAVGAFICIFGGEML